MAKGEESVFKAVVNDTDPEAKGKSYSIEIKGPNYSQFLGKRVGDVVDGIFVGEGDTTLAGYKLEIRGGSDLTGTPMRGDITGGNRKQVMTAPTTGFAGKKRVHYKQKTLRRRKHDVALVRISKPKGLRMRRVFRGNTITTDIIQINLKVVERGSKPLGVIFNSEDEEAGEDA